MSKVKIRYFIDGRGRIDLQLRLIAGETGLDKEITCGEMNRPGLALAGFFDFFAYNRIQIFGQGESAFMDRMSPEDKEKRYAEFFKF